MSKASSLWSIAMLGCGPAAPPPSMTNHVVEPSAWPRRADALCAALGLDEQLGPATLARAGLRTGNEVYTWGGDRYHGRAWDVESSGELRMVGIDARRDDVMISRDQALVSNTISGAWLDSNVSVADICAALALPSVRDAGCARARPIGVLTVVSSDGHSKLACKVHLSVPSKRRR